MAKTRPYLFYDVALSICSKCYRKAKSFSKTTMSIS